MFKKRLTLPAGGIAVLPAFLSVRGGKELRFHAVDISFGDKGFRIL